MDKLEQYVDQVCKSIGGPVELRHHVRQELREHLLDAVAQHKAAGMTGADAVSKALEEFGKPEEVRSELESAYGQRMVWIVDKAMQWKEATMKAKWLWMTWAYLALATVIALEVSFLTFMGIFIIPRFNTLLRAGMIDSEMLQEQPASAWMPGFLNDLNAVGGGYAIWWILLAIVLIGLFEWRVKSENKPFMRLSALGTAAVALMVLVTLTAAAMVIPFCLAMPAFRGIARPFVVDQIVTIDTSLSAIERALTKEKWDLMSAEADKALLAGNHLAAVAFGISSWSQPQPTVEELRAQVRRANEHLLEVRQGIDVKDAKRVEAGLLKFRKAFDPVREAAKRPAR
jgi:hypothetical protein